jgi:hypothetical protein
MVKKNCEVWRKMGPFGPDSDPANQLPHYYGASLGRTDLRETVNASPLQEYKKKMEQIEIKIY